MNTMRNFLEILFFFQRIEDSRKRVINRTLNAKTILQFERYTNGRLATGTIMVVSVIKCDCYRVIYLCSSRDRSSTTYCTTSKWSEDTDLLLYFRKENVLRIGELLVLLLIITTCHISLIKTQHTVPQTHFCCNWFINEAVTLLRVTEGRIQWESVFL